MHQSRVGRFTIALFVALLITAWSHPIGSYRGTGARRAVPKQVETTQAILDLIAQLDSTRYFNTISTLAGWNRYTHGSQILNARDYIQAEFQSLGLITELQSFSVGSTTAYNVIGTLPGTTRPNEWYIVCGHYDSISESPNTAAPGAEDNASGTAGVLELARVLADEPQPATIKFIAFSGEEQGLFGSNAYVQRLIASGDLSKVQGVINMDMISYTIDSDLDVLLETRPFAQSLLDLMQLSAQQFTSLRVVTSFNPCCSDHMPFLNNNVKAVLSIENDWNVYPHYHRTTDTPDHITTAMGMEILKMNLATLAQLMTGVIPSLRVVSPNGGEDWQTGSTQTIQWTSTGTIDNVKIELSRNGGSSYETLFATTPNDGTQSWTVTGPATGSALIKISDVTNPATFDVSNAVFIISEPPPPPPPPPPPGGCAATKVVEGATDAESTLNLLYRFRDEVLASTSRGRYYTQQYYRFSPELTNILALHPNLLIDTQGKLARWRPIIQSLVNLRSASVPSVELNLLDELFRSFAAKASPALRETIEQIRRDVRDPAVQAEFGIRVSR
ncbi:MAG: Zn-dependent exopeptidase M28 [Acidobacteriota bacterium]|nr:Zn-dependent exopeptidase M28 [Blastocatellia bacterium]MDW8240761.1 Zn-dependent exopeptidase M28 [Acidobacteriota bacterium]